MFARPYLKWWAFAHGHETDARVRHPAFYPGDEEALADAGRQSQ